MDGTEESAVTKRWLTWCREHKFVQCMEYDVPKGILPSRYAGTLIDVKVHGGKKRRCPDDKIYGDHEDLRKNVARGNCVLELQASTRESGGEGDNILSGFKKGRYFFVTFALRKFSGGLGDEDEDNSVQNMWNLYFLKPPELADKVVATVKANGEAAHISCRILDGENYFILGSKNVHLLARNLDDVEKYSESRFEFARIIARAFFNNASEMGPENVQKFAEYLDDTRCTAVFELLQRENQHVVNLSYLEKPELQFICWAQPYHEDECPRLCWMSPDVAIDKAKSFGLATVDYSVISASAADAEMSKIRAGVGYEGKVLYYVDESGGVFGLIKKKTCWYIILRAIREKTTHFVSAKNSQSQSERRTKVAKRLSEIQHWLGFSDRYRQTWLELAMGFIQWALSPKRPSGLSCRSQFPVLWEMFIKSSEKYADMYHNLEYET